MTSTAVVRFATEFVKSWHYFRARCLGYLTYGLMRGGRLGVAEIARYIPTHTSRKHHIESVDRFLGNEAVDLLPLWQALLKLAVGSRQWLHVLLDWSDLGQHFEVLRASTS